MAGWEDFGNVIKQTAAGQYVTDFMRIPGKANAIAERKFPGDDRDSSIKNAYRHALGTGMVANHLGGGWPGAIGAKLLGHGWERMKYFGLGDGVNAAAINDERHDYNANAIGAATVMRTKVQWGNGHIVSPNLLFLLYGQ